MQPDSTPTGSQFQLPMAHINSYRCSGKHEEIMNTAAMSYCSHMSRPLRYEKVEQHERSKPCGCKVTDSYLYLIEQRTIGKKKGGWGGRQTPFRSSPPSLR